ncbi:3-[(3aS,4S,7aS)-7a-methyl-1,5-dioxo-octahydro-1H-inden-4-yl]propanoyl:CoA ligase [Nocardia cerradoensis]|uniref:3-[(3aS,4S,7aS)-7a-methyl-1, 5-dioxo-octahydro-1H-inden-4-yl]propanoyl:CoA ligase n=2 Tax=Nocardia cerradoensis TaxID=85688 RepID=A0A231HE34_9NOCA|nr:3-[(3aS,4S,7aS)-7a-methyl-1,5-dioxo-octahydro-1H-inden-4-yl]propanoyl:CoA ligase [Nocardia cerradoensis]
MVCEEMTAEPATIPALVSAQAHRNGSTVAIVEGSARLTYAGLHTEALRVTRAAMARGVAAGDRVAIWAPNSAHWIVTAVGLLGAGATVVPIGTRLRGPEAAALLRRTRCRGLFTVRGFLGIDYPWLLADQGPLPDLEFTVLLSGTYATDDSATSPSMSDDDQDPPTGVARSVTGSGHRRRDRREPDGCARRPPDRRESAPIDWRDFIADAARIRSSDAESRIAAVPSDAISDILFTSGTTGSPKGVLTTHRQTLTVLDRWASAVTLRHGDRCLLVNPFSHTFGYKAGIVACLLRAATMVLVAVFDPRAVADLMTSERITVLAGPPTVFTDLLAVGRSYPELRLAGTGGTAIPADLIARMRAGLGADQVFTAYGLTESVGVVAVCPPGTDIERTAHTVGKALPGSEIRILSADGREVPVGMPGRIVVRGPNVMSGYLDDPDATAAAVDPQGWLHTGDVGTLDADGYLRVTDRLEDMFIVGGFNVSAAEVEQTLLGYPGIAEVAVVGVPDERLGEVGAAFVVPAGTAPFDADDLLAWCRTRLAGYKIPRMVRILDRLPRTTEGKVRKRRLRCAQ